MHNYLPTQKYAFLSLRTYNKYICKLYLHYYYYYLFIYFFFLHPLASFVIIFIII